MREIIKQQNIKKEFYTPEKCYITELSNTPDDPDVSIRVGESGARCDNALAPP